VRILLSARGKGPGLCLLALGYRKAKKPQPGEAEEYQRFETPDSAYRVLVTNLSHTVELLVWGLQPTWGAENLIHEAHNDAGLAAYPSSRWAINGNPFPQSLLAYNPNG